MMILGFQSIPWVFGNVRGFLPAPFDEISGYNTVRSPRLIGSQTSSEAFMWVFPNTPQQLKSWVLVPAAREMEGSTGNRSD